MGRALKPATYTVVRTAEAVRRGEVSASALAEEALMSARLDETNAFVYLTAELAEQAATNVDRLVREGQDPGPLAGIPIAVKDVHDLRGHPTSHGSLAFATTSPPPADSEAVHRLRKAGAVVIGKTTTSELEFSATAENPLTGLTEHPTHPGHTPGGSSGGSAVAVARRVVPLATGSDGGGSLRIPAAACGLPTLKLSAGLVTAADGWGRAPAWPALTSAGLLANDVASLLLGLDVLTGRHSEPGGAPSGPSFSELAERARVGPAPRIAWMPHLGWGETSTIVASTCLAAIERLAAAGAEVVEVAPIDHRDPAPIWTRLAATGTLDWLAEHPARPDVRAVSPKLLELLERWGSDHGRPLQEAHQRAAELKAILASRMGSADVLACPTLASEAPPHAAAASARWVCNTYVFNLAGAVAATLDVGRTGEGLPIGLQFAAPAFHDDELVRALAWADHSLANTGAHP